MPWVMMPVPSGRDVPRHEDERDMAVGQGSGLIARALFFGVLEHIAVELRHLGRSMVRTAT